MDILKQLAEELHLEPRRVESVAALPDDGNTIPFIARYRKEQTGAMDDQVLRSLSERLDYLRRLQEQKEKIRASLEEQEALNEELSESLDRAVTLAELEDLYRPYRPKRRTRASQAKERGLQPLADALYAQPASGPAPEVLAAAYRNPEKGVESEEAALQGARDILAERIADDPAGRARLRAFLAASGELTSQAADEDPGVYAPYGDYREMLKKIPGHRVLAVNRGEREKKLRVGVGCDEGRALSLLTAAHVKAPSPYAPLVREACEDAWSRLLFPALEREARSALTDRASEAAIRVFSQNLRQLLMQPPVRGKVTLGLDPGYRNGCKCAVVDATGRVLDTGVIYPAPPFEKIEQAKRQVAQWIRRHGVQVLAIGNGTASRETEKFAAEVIRELGNGLSYLVVSEAGASVYSASPLAAKEFPDYDVNLRSAVSIARRLQDPLAELVKIDPKAIGVGQYQHDMPQNRLAEALDGVVESCVNGVGVDLNTASAPLLSRVAGVSATVAQNIVAYREEHGPFPSRSELKKVPKLGPRAFEQCAGFLRVPESGDYLDRTAVHPESYPAARELLALCGLGKGPASGSLTPEQGERLIRTVEDTGWASLAGRLGIGEPTLRDMVDELLRPGRDPREELPPPLLRTDVMGIEDLTPGMELEGTVRNVVDFGAFVDIGVHQDGLVHLSRLSSRFIRHPSEVLKVGDRVKVWVLAVDRERKRISLTMVPEKGGAAT